MFKIKTCVSAFQQKQNLKCLNSMSRSLFTSHLRLQAEAAAKVQSAEQNTEWNQAQPYTKIPTDSAFKMMRSFMPGGRYSKMDFEKLVFAIQRDYGDIFLWPAMLGKPAMLFTYNPDDFERVFRNEGPWPNRPGSEVLHYHRNTYRADVFQGIEGLIPSQGEIWSKFRTAVNPVLMQPKSVRLYFNKMSQVNLEFVERIKEIRDPKTLEVPNTFEEDINRWTLESVSVVALDKQLGLLKKNAEDLQAKELFKNITDFFTVAVVLEMNPSIWKYVPTPNYKRAMKALDNILQITSSYTNEALKRLEQDAKNGLEKPENEKSVLEKLLKMDKRIATVMAIDMLTAGVDTTSSAFTGIMLSLAKNPEKQEKLREEVKRILPDKNENFTEESVKSAPYLRACIKEALRLYPLGFGSARVVQKDVVLSDFQVPKDTTILMVAASLLRDERYFPKANEYLPERWLRQNVGTESTPNSLKASNPFIYLPFGFGPRMCIGKRVVEMELELGVARLIRNFRVEFNYPTENAFKTLLFNVPNIPLKFKFTDVE